MFSLLLDTCDIVIINANTMLIVCSHSNTVAAMLAEYIFLNSSLLSLYVNIKILYHTCYYLYMMQIKRSESESEI